MATQAKKIKVIARGTKAIELAQKGATLHVQSSGGYVPAGPGAIKRALRFEPYARWIYVVLQ